MLEGADLQLVPVGGDGDCFLSAVGETLRRVFGWIVPQPPVLRDWLAGALRGDAGHRDVLAAQVQRLLAEERAAGVLRYLRSLREEIIPEFQAWGHPRAGDAADAYIRSEADRMITRFVRPVNDADWARVAEDIQTPGSWNDVAGDITPVLFALVSGVEIMRVSDEGVYPILPPPGAAAVDPAGVPAAIYLVRTRDNHWDATGPADRLPGPQPGPRPGRRGGGFKITPEHSPDF